MKKKKLALIHTVSWYNKSVIEPFANDWSKKNPDVEIINIVDDSLLRESLENGGASEAVLNRIINYVKSAELAGADVVMITCTTVGEASRMARNIMSIPVFNIDEPMAREAVTRGRKLGILATVPTSAPATKKLLEMEAKNAGKDIEITTVINEDAFKHLLAGNIEKHNELVHHELDKLCEIVDVIVLGQISLAQIIYHAAIPVLQVGHSGFQEAARLLKRVGVKE